MTLPSQARKRPESEGVCAARWLQAYADGMAPPVILERCDQSALQVIPLELLKELALPGDDASIPSQEAP